MTEKFRSKTPELVNAMQLTDREAFLDALDWVGRTHGVSIHAGPPRYLHLHDTAKFAHDGDWVVERGSGEFVIWSAAMFKQAYEPADV